MISLRKTARSRVEHEEVDALQEARRKYERALKAAAAAERLMVEADAAIELARRSVRRISER